MHALKILHVTLNMNFGGAEKVIQHLVEGLDRDAYASDVVCIDNEVGPMGQALIDQGYRVSKLGRDRGFDFSLVSRLRKLIRDGDYDVVHCHQYSPYLYGVLAAVVTRAKVVFTEHGRFYPDSGTWKRKLANRFLHWLTSDIVAISEATKQALVIHENFPARTIGVIYNGIEDRSQLPYDAASIRSQWSIPEDHLLLGTISRLQPIKNQKLMIEAFARLLQKVSKATLVMVGDGPSRADLETLANSLNLRDQVVFTGFQDNPYQYHNLLDIFLLSSFSEGTSMTLLEAMSFSTPCVVTDVGGNPEVIEHGKNGYVIDVRADPQVFADACIELAVDHKLRQDFGKHARQLFLDRFTLEHMNRSYEKLYNIH